ncbi:MAG: nitrogen fixation protein FixH [Rubrivivax sp.]|nr:nitrogen fixation protein FixH [Rubrivivax sp.]
MADRNGEARPVLPWWRVRMVWLVIGGPAVVVVASFITLGMALSHPDPVLTGAAPADGAHVPAVSARNHAATPQR